MRIVAEQTLFSVSKPSLFSVFFSQSCIVKPTTQLRMPLSKRLPRKHILPHSFLKHWAPSIWQHFSFISMSDCVKHCIIHLPPQSLFFLLLARFAELREFNVCVSPWSLNGNLQKWVNLLNLPHYICLLSRDSQVRVLMIFSMCSVTKV